MSGRADYRKKHNEPLDAQGKYHKITSKPYLRAKLKEDANKEIKEETDEGRTTS